MTRSILLCSSSGLFHLKPHYRSPTLPSDRGLSFYISSHKNRMDFHGYPSISTEGVPRNEKIKRNFVVCNSGPLPPGPPSSSWNGWILGIVITIVFPFLANKWGPLLRLKNQVDAVVEKVEDVVDAAEEVAERVEKVAEDILDDLPAGKLKNAVSFVEKLAERTGDDAESLGDLIDKVQEVEDKVESIVESATDEETEPHKEASDGAKEPANEAKVEEDQK